MKRSTAVRLGVVLCAVGVAGLIAMRVLVAGFGYHAARRPAPPAPPRYGFRGPGI